MKPFYKDNHNTIYCLDFRKNDLPDECVQLVCTSPPYWGLRKYSGEQELIWGPSNCNHQWQPDNTKHDNLRFRGEHSIVGNERSRDIHPIDNWKDCEHQFDTPTSAIIGSNTLWRPDSDTGLLSLPAIDGKWGETQKGGADRQRKEKVGNFCSLCGAWKGAYGLEPTPEMYIEHTIEILREIRRVLRKDGVVFWNIGDSYATSPAGNKEMKAWKDEQTGKSGRYRLENYRRDLPKDFGNLKPKDLCLIPFRVAIAAQEDGWWVRSVIIWSKNNPMPESVTDRPTESHEYILMLTKSSRYFWDAEAVRERPTADTAGTTLWASLSGATLRMELDATTDASGNLMSLWGRSYFGQPEIPVNLAVTLNAEDLQVSGVICSSIVLEQPERDFVMDLENCIISRDATHFTPITSFGFDKSPDFIPITTPVVNSATSPSGTVRSCKFTSQPERNALPTTKVMARLNIISVTPELITAIITLEDNPLGATLLICTTFASTHTNNIIPQSTTGRNLRSVWSFPTQPFPQAHFAVFPEKLPELCIKAATPEVGCCSKCGAPCERVIEKGYRPAHSRGTNYKRAEGTNSQTSGKAWKDGGWNELPALISNNKTLGWQPTCKCNADKVPSIVLDPMMGAGTTLWVAKKLNRYAVGYEISEEYCQLAVERCRQQVLL